MNKYYLLVLWLVITAQNTTASEEMSDEQKIDFYIGTTISNKCTKQRKLLCSKLDKFMLGNMPQITREGHFVSTMHSGDMGVIHTLDYHDIYALVYFKVSDGDVYFSGLQFIAENDYEVNQVKSYIKLQKNKKRVMSSELGRFISRNENSHTFVQCKKQKRQLFCKQNNPQFNEVYLRAYDGDIYMLALGQVPKMKGSFDTMPGFFISTIGNALFVNE